MSSRQSTIARALSGLSLIDPGDERQSQIRWTGLVLAGGEDLSDQQRTEALQLLRNEASEVLRRPASRESVASFLEGVAHRARLQNARRLVRAIDEHATRSGLVILPDTIEAEEGAPDR